MRERIKLELEPNATQAAFAVSEALENCLLGPRGEGKTEAALVAMSYHAKRHAPETWPVKWIMVRDTLQNHWDQTVPQFRDSRQFGKHLTFNPDGALPRKVSLLPYWTCTFIGVDERSDLDKLRGVYGGVWFEEVAPVMDEATRSKGIGLEAWETALSGFRQRDITPRAQITGNYPDEDHWVWNRFKTNAIPGTALFEIPVGENIHYSAKQRELLSARWLTNPAMRARMVEGRPGFVAPGEAVTPEFDERFHVSRYPLDVLRGIPMDMLWDFGLTPCAIFTQVAPTGQWRIYDAIPGENMGIKQLIEGPLTPFLEGKYRGLPVSHIGGEEGLIREGSNSEQTAVGTLTKLISGSYTPGPIAWPQRRDALRDLHNTKLGAFGSAVTMDPKAALPLILALKGRWHYQRNASGQVMREKPVKNHPWSDLGDAYAAGAAIKFPRGTRKASNIRSIKSPSYGWTEPVVIVGR